MRPRSWHRGRNAASVYWTRLHVTAFRPSRPYGNGSSYGLHVRFHRRVGTWRHFIVRLFHRAEPIPGARGCWQWEAEHFESLRAKSTSGAGNRVTVKAFIRLRIGLGGGRDVLNPRPSDRRSQQKRWG